LLDFRALIATLEARGEIVRIRRPVDPRFEMAALMQQVDRQRRGYIFENVKGAKFPLVGGLLNRIECYGWALGSKPGEPYTLADLSDRLAACQSRRVAPRLLDTGPVKENILRGAQINLADVPAPTVFEFDSGAFLTGACGVTRNPRTGKLNVGIYRTLVLGRDTMSVSASSSSDLRRIYQDAETHGGSMPIALAIGVEPALLMAATCKLPPDECEYDFAGALQDEPIELVKCETSDLLVPARAEMVIEGRVDFSRKLENTLGEFAGQYGPETAPVTTITAITYRNDAMHYSILAGRNPEHTTLASIAGISFRRALSAALRNALPRVKDLRVFIDPKLGSMHHIVMSIAKRDDAEPMELIDTAFRTRFVVAGVELPVERITKRVIVVDDDIDVQDMDEVEWALWTRTADARKYVVRPDVASWELERCAKPGRGSLRIAIDATSDLDDREKLRRTIIPEAAKVKLADYVDKPA
jgi:2,5-furandicarboxylate decarboxylase 1